MGCAQSKVDNEESVSRCKERKILMKEAVVARNAFAAGHSGYAMSLKNTGAALSDYAHGEAEESQLQQQQQQHPLDPTSEPPVPPPPPPLPIENLPPPPPPLPNFSPSPIKRAMSMPEIPLTQLRKAGRGMDSVAIAEEEEEEEEEEEHGLNHGARNRNNNGNRNSTNNKDSNGMRGPHNGRVGPEGSPPRTPENHSVPPMPEAKNLAWDYFFMVDNIPGPSLEPEVEEEDDVGRRDDSHFDNVGHLGPSGSEEPKTPEKRDDKEVAPEVTEDEEEEEGEKKRTQIEHSKTAPPEFSMMGNIKGGSVPSVNLMQVLTDIDDHFLKASESAQEVSKMLEATRLHYHSNFADNRGNY